MSATCSVKSRSSASRAAARPGQMKDGALHERSTGLLGGMLVQRDDVGTRARQERADRGHQTGAVIAAQQQPAHVLGVQQVAAVREFERRHAVDADRSLRLDQLCARVLNDESRTLAELPGAPVGPALPGLIRAGIPPRSHRDQTGCGVQSRFRAVGRTRGTRAERASGALVPPPVPASPVRDIPPLSCLMFKQQQPNTRRSANAIFLGREKQSTAGPQVAITFPIKRSLRIKLALSSFAAWLELSHISAANSDF